MRLLTLLTAMAVMVLMVASTAPATVHLCSNHPNQQSAPAALDQDPSLAPTLDPDGNVVACEGFFGTTASPTTTATADATASPPATASPTAAALAVTGGPPLVVPLTLVASLMLVDSGIAALSLVRRGAS